MSDRSNFELHRWSDSWGLAGEEVGSYDQFQCLDCGCRRRVYPDGSQLFLAPSDKAWVVVRAPSCSAASRSEPDVHPHDVEVERGRALLVLNPLEVETLRSSLRDLLARSEAQNEELRLLSKRVEQLEVRSLGSWGVSLVNAALQGEDRR